MLKAPDDYQRAKFGTIRKLNDNQRAFAFEMPAMLIAGHVLSFIGSVLVIVSFVRLGKVWDFPGTRCHT